MRAWRGAGEVLVLIARIEVVRLYAGIVSLYRVPLPARVPDAGGPLVVVGRRALEVDAEVEDARPAEALAACVRDGALVERGFGLRDVAVVEVWAEEGGVVAVRGRVEELAGRLGAGFEDQDGRPRGGVGEVVREKAAGCARWEIVRERLRAIR